MTEKSEDGFKITDDEMTKIKNALKDKEFRKMFMEYANEISDPENKKRYEEEIIAMEQSRGQDVRLLKPTPGFVVKTKRLSDHKKVFVNVCTSLEIENFTSNEGKKNGVSGTHIKLPHSITPLRQDLDKGGGLCDVYDACFHPNTYKKANESSAFRKVLVDTIFDALETQLSEHLDRKNLKFPRLKYKGTSQPSIIRQNGEGNNNMHEAPTFNDVMQSSTDVPSNSADFIDPLSTADQLNTLTNNGKVSPQYSIVHRGYFDMQSYANNSSNNKCNRPKELVINIEVPLVASASEIDLDIFEKQLLLHSEQYYLDLSLSYSINDDEGKAQFDKTSKVLTVTLPLLKKEEECIQKSLVTEVQSSEVNNSENNTNPLNVSENCLEDTVFKNEVGCLDQIERRFDECLDRSLDGCKDDENGLLNGCKDLVKGKSNTRNEESDAIDSCTNSDKHDISSLKSFSFNKVHLPPYSYHQSKEDLSITIHVKDVKVIDVSIGFTPQEAYISFPQHSNNPLSPDWSIFVRLLEKDYLKNDECSFEIESECLKIKLVKEAHGIFNSVFIGPTDNNLELISLTTVSSYKDELGNKKSRITSPPTIFSMEGRLNQLLNEQDRSAVSVEYDDTSAGYPVMSPRSFSADVVAPPKSSIDKLACGVNLMDLQDDVIEEVSPLQSPNSDLNNSKKSRFSTRRVFERSVSHDHFQHSRLKSILKRSKSDCSNWDTDEDLMYSRQRRGLTVSDECCYTSTDDDTTFQRRRHKSVSFLDKPIVFEFQKMSKRQWKKQLREESRNDRKQKENQDSSDQNETTGKKQKQSRKKKKAEKKRNRINSESRSEEEGEVTDTKVKKQRKKSKKKGANLNIVGQHTLDNSSAESSNKDSRSIPTLNNPLIFQLD